MRSSVSFRGLPDTSEFFGSMNYVYGITDFWSFMFEDKEVVDRTLEATSYQLSDLYSKFLQLTSTISLQDIRTTFHSQLKLVLLDEDSALPDIEVPLAIRGSVSTPLGLPQYQLLPTKELRDEKIGEAYHVRNAAATNYLYVFTGVSWVPYRSLHKYNLPIDAMSCRYLMDRPFLPRVTLENKVHFYIYPENHVLELHSTVYSSGAPSRKILKTGVISFSEEITGPVLTHRIYLGSTGFSIDVTQDTRPDLYEGANTLSVKIGDTIEYETSQFAFWATDVEIDEGALWSYFGRFVNISPATSTQLYRDFIKGLYFLYSRGPTLRLLQLGLNLCIGIPTARANETILHFFQDGETGNYNVVTANNSYTIPYGIPPDYAIGDNIAAGDELAQVAQIKDYKTDADWWVNISIPRKILPEYPTNLSAVAVSGSTLEYYMRNFLKFNTFLVNIKLVSGIGSTSINSITSLIDSAKAAYTMPVYVWTVPITQDLLKPLDDDLTVAPTLTIGDVLLYGEMIRRSKAFLPTTDITSYPGAGLLGVGYNYRNVSSSYITDGTTYLPPGKTATAITNTLWKLPAKLGERACGRWIRSNTDLTGYLGDTVDVVHELREVATATFSIVSGTLSVTSVSHGLTSGDYVKVLTDDLPTEQALVKDWYIVSFIDVDTFSIYVGDAIDASGTLEYSYIRDIQDSSLVPLYNLTAAELTQKLVANAISIGSLPSRFVVDGLDGTDTGVYTSLFIREGSPATGIGYNCGDLPPFILESKRRFVPIQGTLSPNESLAFFRVVHGVYSVFLIQGPNVVFNPVYFPPREEDPIQITKDYVNILTPDEVVYVDDSF